MRMRMLRTTGLVLLGLLAGCDAADDDDLVEFNALPQVGVELDGAAAVDGDVELAITLVDEDGELCSLAVDVSFDDGASYTAASVWSDETGLDEVACTRVGERFTVLWDAAADRPDGADAALLRLQASDPHEPGPPTHQPVTLTGGTPEAHGVYLARSGAPLPQWQYQRLGLARVEVIGTAVSVVQPAELLSGGDDAEADGDGSVKWSYALPEPPPEHMTPLQLGGDRLGHGAIYLPFVWKDEQPRSEPNPVYDDDDPIAGVAHRALLAYVDPDGDWTAPGWLMFALQEDVGGQVLLEQLDIGTELHVLLKGYSVDDLVNHPLEVPVTNAATIPAVPEMRVGLLPPPPVEGIPAGMVEATSIPFDNVTEALAFALHANDLPDTHWDDMGFGFFAEHVAREAFFLYQDQDVSGDASEGEPVSHQGMAELDGGPLRLVYLDAEMKYGRLWDWARDECWAGFNLITGSDESPTDFPSWACYSTDAAPELTFEHLP